MPPPWFRTFLLTAEAAVTNVQCSELTLDLCHLAVDCPYVVARPAPVDSHQLHVIGLRRVRDSEPRGSAITATTDGCLSSDSFNVDLTQQHGGAVDGCVETVVPDVSPRSPRGASDFVEADADRWRTTSLLRDPVDATIPRMRADPGPRDLTLTLDARKSLDEVRIAVTTDVARRAGSPAEERRVRDLTANSITERRLAIRGAIHLGHRAGAVRGGHETSLATPIGRETMGAPVVVRGELDVEAPNQRTMIGRQIRLRDNGCRLLDSNGVQRDLESTQLGLRRRLVPL